MQDRDRVTADMAPAILAVCEKERAAGQGPSCRERGYAESLSVHSTSIAPMMALREE